MLTLSTTAPCLQLCSIVANKNVMYLSLETPTPPPTPGRRGALDSSREKMEEKAPPYGGKLLV